MATNTDTAKCNGFKDDALSPFSALNYHFGMLLGVEDFSTEQAYHRGKMRLHNAWLHGMGVVWGFDVQVDMASGEVRVTPGLALDGAGRELHLDGPACVYVGRWFDEHKAEITAAGDDYKKVFDAYVSVQFKSCLTRQVPALLDPCEGAGGGVAYSRISETIDLRLLPGSPPDPPEVTNHRVRVLLGLAVPKQPADDDVVNEIARIVALPVADQPSEYMLALRRLAAADTVDAKPAAASDGLQNIFPVQEDTPVVLAAIKGITIVRQNDAWTLTAGAPDVTVRPSLIPTATIQELVCGPLIGGGVPQAASPGPGVRPETVAVGDNSIEFETDKDLQPLSLNPGSFAVSVWDNAQGWISIGVNTPAFSGSRKVTVPLKTALAPDARVRFIARGTGESPIVGTDFTPLAGAVGGPHPAAGDGIDFVMMRKRS